MQKQSSKELTINRNVDYIDIRNLYLLFIYRQLHMLMRAVFKRLAHYSQWHWAGAILFFAGATILMTWPLAAHMSSAVIGWKGDNLYYVWLLGWVKNALSAGQNPLVVPFLNFPYGWNLAYTEITPVNNVMGLPFSLALNPVFAYNAVILLTYVLSGVFVYGWVVGMTQNRSAGLVAGALFAFSPYRVAHSYGHLPLMGTQWLVLHYAGLLLSDHPAGQALSTCPDSGYRYGAFWPFFDVLFIYGIRAVSALLVRVFRSQPQVVC